MKRVSAFVRVAFVVVLQASLYPSVSRMHKPKLTFARLLRVTTLRSMAATDQRFAHTIFQTCRSLTKGERCSGTVPFVSPESAVV